MSGVNVSQCKAVVLEVLYGECPVSTYPSGRRLYWRYYTENVWCHRILVCELALVCGCSHSEDMDEAGGNLCYLDVHHLGCSLPVTAPVSAVLAGWGWRQGW